MSTRRLIGAGALGALGMYLLDENFPKIMAHIREVRETGDGRSHWTVAGPAGVPIEWDTEVTARVPNEVIAWRTLPGSLVGHDGIVRFEATPTAAPGSTSAWPTTRRPGPSVTRWPPCSPGTRSGRWTRTWCASSR